MYSKVSFLIQFSNFYHFLLNFYIQRCAHIRQTVCAPSVVNQMLSVNVL